MTVWYLSPAKLNLRLQILGKREDGYHEILSLMQPISLYDGVGLSISRGKGIELAVKGRPIPSGRGNLAWRAAELLLERAGIDAMVRICIKKVIPVAAGLGGGSSNAATVLQGLNELLGRPLDSHALFDLARRLGADVPFFLMKGAAIARGIGDILEPVELPRPWYVLVWPGRSISTSAVYRAFNFDLTKVDLDINMRCSIENLGGVESLRALLYNDLERVTLRMCPEIEDIKGSLREQGAIGALMSGSGATVFGLFRDKASARRALQGMVDRFRGRGWSFYIARGL